MSILYMNIQAILTAQNTSMRNELSAITRASFDGGGWRRFGNCIQEARLTYQKIQSNLQQSVYINNYIYYYNYGTGHLDGCIKATKNYWKVRLLVAHGAVDPGLITNPSKQNLMTLKQQIDEAKNPESASNIQQKINSASYRPPYQTYMINQSVCGVNTRLNRPQWIQLRNRLSELGHYLNNRHNLAECNEDLSPKSLARTQDYSELTTDTAYKNVIKRSLRNLVGDVPSENTAYATTTAKFASYGDPWNLEVNNSNTHVTNSSISLNQPMGGVIEEKLVEVPTVDENGDVISKKVMMVINDNVGIPVIAGVLCLNPIEINTAQEANSPILPTFTILRPDHSIQMHHLLLIDQMIHSIYSPGFPNQRKNDKYIVANVSCRGFSQEFPTATARLDFIKAMRQTSVEQHQAESPRTIGHVDPRIWSGGKRKKTRRKRRRRKSKKTRKSRKKRKSRKRRKSRRRKRK